MTKKLPDDPLDSIPVLNGRIYFVDGADVSEISLDVARKLITVCYGKNTHKYFPSLDGQTLSIGGQALLFIESKNSPTTECKSPKTDSCIRKIGALASRWRENLISAKEFSERLSAEFNEIKNLEIELRFLLGE